MVFYGEYQPLFGPVPVLHVQGDPVHDLESKARKNMRELTKL